MSYSVAFFDIIFLGVINFFAIRYLHRLVITHQEPIKKFIDELPVKIINSELPVILVKRLINPNVLASIFISLVLAFLSVIILVILPNNFAVLVGKQISLFQSYIVLFKHYQNMVISNQISVHDLTKMILAKQFTLQDIIDFAYLNRLVLIPLFLLWFVGFVFRIYLYLVDIKKEKIKHPEDILIFALFFYATGLGICIVTKVFNLVPIMHHFVLGETLLFWFIMICCGARFSSFFNP